MIRKIGIGLLIILNLGFIYLIVMYASLAYGLMVVPIGKEEGIETANETSSEILINIFALSIVVFLLNYLLAKKMIASKKPILISCLFTLIGIIVFIPFFLSAKQSFIKYQTGSTQFRHYLDIQTIAQVHIITQTDTFRVEQLNDFMRDIGYSPYKKGPLKFARTFKLIFERTNGSKDSSFTNGQVFVYKLKFFQAAQNIIDKYSY